MNDQELIKLFDAHAYAYELFRHAPIFTAKDGGELVKTITGAHGKNLFLKDKKNNYYLISLMEHKRVDLKALAQQIDGGRFSFGNEVELMRFIGVKPGSVTPYGLVHDVNKEVSFYLDEDLLRHETVNFHPLRNDQTVQMKTASFLAFFDDIQHVPHVIAIPEMCATISPSR
jgi:Ala-tRNA(Pro) deacylase